GWRWTHHGSFRFEGDEEPIEVIEVGEGEAVGPPRTSRGVERLAGPGARRASLLEPGQSLLRYRIQGVLGRGGMGEVYLAEDGRLRRQVAIKTLPQHLARDREHLLRFEREIQAVAAINHPNIVTIHNVEQDGDRRFLTMELVEGETLNRRVQPGGLPLKALLEIAVPLAEALSAAHASGVVHRDLKPSNVMVSDDGRLKVLDFGLAKLRDDAETITALDQMIGTLAYVAPEQLRGEKVDPRADVFSFGVILFELASGERPFRGSGPSLMYSVLNSEPAALESLRPDLPEDLTRLIGQCLVKRPGERRLDASGLARRLSALRREVRGGRGARTGGPTRSRFSSWGLSARRSLGAAALLAAGLAVAAALLALRPRDGGGQEGAAPASAKIAAPRLVFVPCGQKDGAEEDFLADGLSAEITSRLAAEKNLEVISHISARRYRQAERSLQEIGEELRVTHVARCEVSRRGKDPTHVQLDLELFELGESNRLIYSRSFDHGGEDLYQLQREISRRVVSALGFTFGQSPETAEPTPSSAAFMEFIRGRHTASVPDYTLENQRRAVGHFRRATELDPGFLEAWAELAKAEAFFFHLRHDTSPQQAARARRAADRALALGPLSAQARLADGMVHYWTERAYGKALEDLRYAEGLLKNDPEIYASMAFVLRRQGRGEEALRKLHRAVELNPRDAALTTHTGATAIWLRRYAEARSTLRNAIEIEPERPMAFWLEAQALWLWTGSTETARQALEAMPSAETDERVHWYWFLQLYHERRPRAARERLALDPDGWIDISSFSAPVALPEAMTWQLEGDEERAREAWSRALEALRHKVDSSPRRMADARLASAFALALAAAGEREAALEASSRALESRPLSLDAYEGPSYRIHRAHVHVLLSEPEEAVERLAELLQIPSRLSVPLLRLDPRWDPLRGRADFQALIAGGESDPRAEDRTSGR
ncbi:MAG: protein kinase, partial [Acidobacteriota bacterium]